MHDLPISAGLDRAGPLSGRKQECIWIKRAMAPPHSDKPPPQGPPKGGIEWNSVAGAAAFHDTPTEIDLRDKPPILKDVFYFEPQKLADPPAGSCPEFDDGPVSQRVFPLHFSFEILDFGLVYKGSGASHGGRDTVLPFQGSGPLAAPHPSPRMRGLPKNLAFAGERSWKIVRPRGDSAASK